MIIPHRWSRDEAIEVCLEALATGRVHGISPNHDPDVLAMNSAFSQNGLGSHGMVRDWGLFEAHFTGPPMRCQFFVVQAHRMRKPPKWNRLRRALDGFDLVPGDFSVPGSAYHRVAVSDSEVCVDEETGRVMKISVPAAPPLPRPGPAPKSLWREVRSAASGPRDSWAGWLGRRPAGEWMLHLAAMHNLRRQVPRQRATWTAFGLWLLDQVRDTCPADEWAWRWARFVLDEPGTVPAGEVVRTCLAALPMSRDEAAALPRDWRARTPSEIRRSRMTLALLRCAEEDAPPAPAPPPGLTLWKPLLRTVG